MGNIYQLQQLNILNGLAQECAQNIELGFNEEANISAYGELSRLALSARGEMASEFQRIILDMKYDYLTYEDGKKVTASEVVGIDIDTAATYSFNSTEKMRQEVENFTQAVLVQMLFNNPRINLRLRLIDALNAGSSFGALVKVAASDENAYGGRVFSSDQDVSKCLGEIERLIQDNIAKLYGRYRTVFDYNRENAQKIPITVLTVFDAKLLNNANRTKLRTIEQNALEGGILLIKVFPDDEQDVGVKDIEVTPENGVAKISVNERDFNIPYSIAHFSIEDIDKISEKVSVDTSAAKHMGGSNLFGRKADDRISIPFAIDDYGNISEFEIGGKAPAHALLSGGTGSGKSVTLHTIIQSIILNYHPDDVELWLIDYKAVEFAEYAELRSPHITVVGQDNSEDFSISLLDIISKEYARRKQLFIEQHVQDIEGYRRNGKSLSRIVIIIDEFHNLTQMVQTRVEYKNTLENLLSEMRAVGMSFIFCSQTISNGLQGLTQKGRDQISCRLCMKHDNTDEIRETLAENMSTASSYVSMVKDYAPGQVLYKKRRDTGGYDYEALNVLYFSPEDRKQNIEQVNSSVGEYIKKHEIICKNSERYSVAEKKEHFINKYILGEERNSNPDEIYIYPGAPTNLEDEFVVKLERAPGNNLIMAVSDEQLRNSVLIHSLMGLLADENVVVNVSVFDDKSNDGRSILSACRMFSSKRLKVFNGGKECINHIAALNKLRPMGEQNQVELIYGLNKLSSILYVMDSDENEDEVKAETVASEKASSPRISGETMEDKMASLDAFLSSMKSMERKSKAVLPEKKEEVSEKEYTADELFGILSNLYEHGPDLGYFSVLILGNVKQLKQMNVTKLNDFEYRIGGKMTADESYTLFQTEGFASKADDKTLVCFKGTSKHVYTFRPYLIDDVVLEKFNERGE